MPVQPLRTYLGIVGSLLFLQGAAVLLLLNLGISLPSPWSRAVRPDVLHGWIHIIWALAIWVSLKQRKTWAMGWGFGLFYLLFSLVGFVFQNPGGLLLGSGENLFHLLAGAIAIYLVSRSPHRSKIQ